MDIMDKIDANKAARVWQRVRSDPAMQRPEQGLLELIAQEGADAATYLQLSRRFQGKDSNTLRKLFEQEQSHAACLKGIYMLITGTRPTTRALQPEQGDPESILRRCYGAEMRCLARYEERSSDPEYGHVFTRLAEQEREHCHYVLELLGKLNKVRP